MKWIAFHKLRIRLCAALLPLGSALAMMGCSAYDPESSLDPDVGSSEQAVVSCPAGKHLECDNGCDDPPCTKPVCHCEVNPPTPITGFVYPSFYITHVVYAVPGKSSSVTYSNGSTFGSTTSTTSSWKTDEKDTAKASFKILAGADASFTSGQGWGGTDTTSVDATLSLSSGYSKKGAVDLVDHDDDEIWLVLRPTIDVTITPESPGTQRSISWQFDPNQQLVRFPVYVKELKHPCMMPANTKALLDSYGVTSDYYDEILKADPFAKGETNIDPERFEKVGSFPYVPPNNPGDPSSTQMQSVSRNTSRSFTHVEDESFSSSYSVGGGAAFGSWLNLSLSTTTSWTWTHSTSNKTTTGQSSSDSLTIGQPAFGYDGPEIVDVYVDHMWKTYVFVLSCGPLSSAMCGFSACSAEGTAVCQDAGASWCEARPGQRELCRWKSGTETQVPGQPPTQCGNAKPDFAIACDNGYGIWTPYNDPFARGNPGSVPSTPGACITQTSNLCSSDDFAICKANGATTCEKISSAVDGHRFDVCRWRNVDAAHCGSLSGPNTVTGNRGIWTTPQDKFAQDYPAAVQNGVGSCISEVSNLTPTRNLALGQPAFQWPDPGWAPASNAVDGNTDGNWYANSVTHTDQTAGPWWWVDLGSVQHIRQINLFNRTDCCSSRLSHYVVAVSADSTNGWDGSWPWVVDASNITIADGDGTTQTHPVDVWARWVAVGLTDTDYLSLAEVQVLAW